MIGNIQTKNFNGRQLKPSAFVNIKGVQYLKSLTGKNAELPLGTIKTLTQNGEKIRVGPFSRFKIAEVSEDLSAKFSGRGKLEIGTLKDANISAFGKLTLLVKRAVGKSSITAAENTKLNLDTANGAAKIVLEDNAQAGIQKAFGKTNIEAYDNTAATIGNLRGSSSAASYDAAETSINMMSGKSHLDANGIHTVTTNVDKMRHDSQAHLLGHQLSIGSMTDNAKVSSGVAGQIDIGQASGDVQVNIPNTLKLKTGSLTGNAQVNYHNK